MTPDIHTHAMHHALRLAARQLGRTAPNPAVGCVIIKNNEIIGVGVTERGGRPHAETQALAMAGANAKDATMFVTLEPCSHHGTTPPCCEAIKQAGLKECYIACHDPNPQVNGQGAAYLQKHGVQIYTGLCQTEALNLNEGFFLTQTQRKPFITAKIATSSNHQMVTPKGKSPTITSPTTQQYGHLLRANHDAILTGIGTVLADDPLLTCRILGRESDSPIRIVLDRQLRIPPKSALVKSAKHYPLWIFASQEHVSEFKAQELKDAGVMLHPLPHALTDLMPVLVTLGITRLLLESGPTLTHAFLSAKLVESLYWYKAPHALDQHEHHNQSKLELELEPVTAKTPERSIFIGDDLLRVYRIAPCLPASLQI